MIRPAKFGDIPSIFDMIVEGHSRSKYAGRDAVDAKECKSLLMGAIQRHGLKREGGTCVLVTERVDGFIMGILDRVYHVGTKLTAQDMFFYARATSFPQDRVGLLDAYIRWADSVPNVIEIRNGITDILGDVEKVELIYQRMGFRRCGVMVERTVE